MKTATVRQPFFAGYRVFAATLVLLLGLGSQSVAQPVISFATTDSVKAKSFENQGTVGVAVMLNAPSGSPVAVQYATVTNGSTAVQGTNYVGTSGTLVFQPGETLKNFTIQVLDDHSVDPTLYINVVLSNPQGGVLNQSNCQGSVGLWDTDGPSPTVQFSATNYIVQENNGSVTITANLSGPWYVPISCQYAYGGGTAIPNVDYTPLEGGQATLTFSPWDTTKTFTISILDDGYPGNNVTLSAALSNPTNATLGSPQGATITLIPDQPLPTVTLSPNPLQVYVGATGTLTPTLTAFDDAQYLSYVSQNVNDATVYSDSGDSAGVTGQTANTTTTVDA